MKRISKARNSLVLGTAALIGFAAFGTARSASASANYPAALAAALQAQFPGESFCVPLCTACHNTTKGGPGDLNVFGTNLFTKGLVRSHPEFVQTALTADFMAMPPTDSDGDGISDQDELKAKSSPSIALPRGEGEFCSDLTYGCGARIAAAPPPVDRVGLFSAGLVVFGLTMLRRRHRTASR